jgi:uncharacterized protein YjbI with pentapeptide repeats
MMANEEPLMPLRRGVASWNQWRAENPEALPDLVRAGLRGLDLTGANLAYAQLKEADLRARSSAARP